MWPGPLTANSGPYHGWLLGYDAATLRQELVQVVTPSGKQGGIWQSNSGPSADRWGNLYLTVGNGTATAQTGGRNYGNAFLKLSPSGAVLDWFIPHNFEELNEFDLDLGAAGVLLIPNTNLLTSGGKEGKLYLLDRGNFGQFHAETDDVVQSLMVAEGGLFGTPTYWDGPNGPYVYVWGASDYGKMFRLREGQLDPEPVSQTIVPVPRPGGILSLSANGAVPGSGHPVGPHRIGQCKHAGR